VSVSMHSGAPSQYGCTKAESDLTLRSSDIDDPLIVDRS
jgi:hypothetical protein